MRKDSGGMTGKAQIYTARTVACELALDSRVPVDQRDGAKGGYEYQR